jgi:16S rRNA U1498 N3-methylase RsmE
MEAKINKIIPQKQETTRHTSMLIAMPNKQEKIELIVQKLTEI